MKFNPRRKLNPTMNSNLVLLGIVLTTALIGGCDGDRSAPKPVPPTSQSLDTAQVLVLAQNTSETSTPLAVNGGALVLNDTSETSSPIPVSAM